MALKDATDMAEAVVALAHQWTNASVVKDFSAPIKASRSGSTKSDLIAPFLAHLFAGYGSFAAQPLLLATFAQISVQVEEDVMGGGLPETRAFAQSDEGKRWLEVGGRVQEAFLRTVAWVRSRLPGYPNLNVPQLIPGSALMPSTPNFRVPWRQRDLAAGYQTMNSPPGLTELIGISSGWDRLCRLVAREYRNSAEVTRFKEARLALNDTDRTALTAARSQTKELLRERSAVTPPGLMPQLQLREELLTESCSDLPKAALEYCEAFSQAEGILQDIFSIFSQIVAFGGAPVFHDVESIETRPHEGQTLLRAVINDGPGVWHIHSGGVILIEHAHVELSLLLVQAFGFSFDRGQAETIHEVEGFVLPVEARVLDDSRLDV